MSRGCIFTTAASFRALLCYIDPVNTPKISADDDSLIDEIIARVKKVVGDKDGSQDLAWHYNGSDPVDMQIVKCFRNIEKAIHSVCYCLERAED